MPPFWRARGVSIPELRLCAKTGAIFPTFASFAVRIEDPRYTKIPAIVPVMNAAMVPAIIARKAIFARS